MFFLLLVCTYKASSNAFMYIATPVFHPFGASSFCILTFLSTSEVSKEAQNYKSYCKITLLD